MGFAALKNTFNFALLMKANVFVERMVVEPTINRFSPIRTNQTVSKNLLLFKVNVVSKKGKGL